MKIYRKREKKVSKRKMCSDKHPPWGEVLLGILGRGVPPGSPNPDPISDQNMLFSTPVFRPGF